MTKLTAVGVANAIASVLQASGDSDYAAQQLQAISNALLDGVADKQEQLEESLMHHYGDGTEMRRLTFCENLGDLLGDRAIELDDTFYADAPEADL